jgi:hypothetical protein
MSLDLDRLENARLHGGKLIAACPACREAGADRAGDHLFIAEEGRGAFGCIVNPGPAGEAHRKRIFELVGTQDTPSPPRRARLTPAPKPAPRIPPLRTLKVFEMDTITRLRGWPLFAGLELLTQRGLLWQGAVFDDGREWSAWIVTDATHRNAQARRIDGETWQGIGGKKAKTLPGADPSWPIGAADIGERPLVLLCEGQPDYCAALLVAWFEGLPVDRVAPVCMTGAGNAIHADALPLFAGKRVRIAVHADEQGREAGERWAAQLYRAGAVAVDGVHFEGLTKRDGQPVKDLADFATLLDPDEPPAVRVLSDLVTDSLTPQEAA